MDEQGCGCFAIVALAVIAIVCFCASSEQPHRVITQKELNRMVDNAEWFACKTFPELEEIIDGYEIKVIWISGDLDKARDDMAKQDGIIIMHTEGVWDKNDVTVGTCLICRQGTFVFLKKDIPESEGAVWETYTHELRHLYHDLRLTRTELLKEEAEEPFRTLHEEIRTSREMVHGIERFLDNDKVLKELNDATYRKNCIEELKGALSSEKELIRKYNRRLKAAEKRRAESTAPGWLYAPGVLFFLLKKQLIIFQFI